jgi:hypothetical protein
MCVAVHRYRPGTNGLCMCIKVTKHAASRSARLELPDAAAPFGCLPLQGDKMSLQERVSCKKAILPSCIHLVFMR